MNWKDVFVRAVKTAVEAMVITVPVLEIMSHVSPTSIDLSGLATVGLGGVIAAGAGFLTVGWNALLEWSRKP